MRIAGLSLTERCSYEPWPGLALRGSHEPTPALWRSAPITPGAVRRHENALVPERARSQRWDPMTHPTRTGLSRDEPARHRLGAPRHALGQLVAARPPRQESRASPSVVPSLDPLPPVAQRTAALADSCGHRRSPATPREPSHVTRRTRYV